MSAHRFAAVLLALLPLSLAAQQRSGFPHDRHAGLFSACAECHTGIPTGDAVRSFPPVSLCQSCHNGRDVAEVPWNGAAPISTGFLKFAHASHPGIEDATSCRTCHAATTSREFLDVGRAANEQCRSCHEGSAHLADDSACATCHRPVARAAGLPESRIARFARPPTHAKSDFATRHLAASGDVATCSVCHARESCARCHGERSSLAPVERLERDPRVARLVAGKAATRIHRARFRDAHAVRAAADPASCAGCHAQRVCSDCHAAERSARRYHATNFMTRHSSAAYTRDVECSTCHNSEAFCRSCHQRSGVGTRTGGIRTQAWHNGTGAWLLQHARAARQELTTCTSCHQQRDCLQCHSQAGSRMRVNPHGPDFDARRMADRNKGTCLICHLRDPLAP